MQLLFEFIGTQFVQVSENLGGIKESDNFSDFFHNFLFSHKFSNPIRADLFSCWPGPRGPNGPGCPISKLASTD